MVVGSSVFSSVLSPFLHRTRGLVGPAVTQVDGMSLPPLQLGIAT